APRPPWQCRSAPPLRLAQRVTQQPGKKTQRSRHPPETGPTTPLVRAWRADSEAAVAARPFHPFRSNCGPPVASALLPQGRGAEALHEFSPFGELGHTGLACAKPLHDQFAVAIVGL